MDHGTKRSALACGALALIAALAPAPAALDVDGEIKALAEAKVKVVRRILDYSREMLHAPPGEKGVPPAVEVAEQIRYWSRLLVNARLEATDRREERIAILTEEVEQARVFEKELKTIAEGEPSGSTRLSANKAEYSRLDVETRLAREKAGK